MANKKKKWPILLLYLLVVGLLLLFLSWGSFFGIFTPETPLSENIKGGAMMLLLSILFLFPVYEAIQKNIFNKKTYLERYREQLAKAQAELPTDKHKLKKQKIKATIYICLFISYILTPIIWPHYPTYEFSNNTIILLWLMLFPAIWINWSAVVKLNFKNTFTFGRFFLSAFSVAIFFLYIEIIQSYINTDYKEINAEINSVGRGGRTILSCNQRVSLTNQQNIRKNFCIDNLSSHNLINGDVIYIENGNAVLKIRHGWLGTVVDSILWKQKYTASDRKWLREEKRFIYYGNKNDKIPNK